MITLSYVLKQQMTNGSLTSFTGNEQSLLRRKIHWFLLWVQCGFSILVIIYVNLQRQIQIQTNDEHFINIDQTPNREQKETQLLCVSVVCFLGASTLILIYPTGLTGNVRCFQFDSTRLTQICFDFPTCPLLLSEPQNLESILKTSYLDKYKKYLCIFIHTPPTPCPSFLLHVAIFILFSVLKKVQARAYSASMKLHS